MITKTEKARSRRARIIRHRSHFGNGVFCSTRGASYTAFPRNTARREIPKRYTTTTEEV